MDKITYYHILGVSSDATDDEILAAFRRCVKEWHPDVCSHPDAEERMREINKAAEILCDPERRKRYDRALAGKAPFEKEPVPRTTRKTNGKKREAGLSAIAARMISRKRGQARPNIMRSAPVALALLFIVLAILAVTYYAYPIMVSIAPSSTAGMTGTGMPKSAPVDAFRSEVTEQGGNALLTEGNFSGALAAYDAVIAKDPAISERDIWYNRGIALQALGMYSEAAGSFDRALQVSPDDSLALAQKGAALIGLGRYNESLDYTDKALAKTPETAWIWSNRGIALEHLGDNEGARKAFEKAGIPFALSGDALYRNVILSPDSAGGF